MLPSQKFQLSSDCKAQLFLSQAKTLRHLVTKLTMKTHSSRSRRGKSKTSKRSSNMACGWVSSPLRRGTYPNVITCANIKLYSHFLHVFIASALVGIVALGVKTKGIVGAVRLPLSTLLFVVHVFARWIVGSVVVMLPRLCVFWHRNNNDVDDDDDGEGKFA